MAVLSAPRWQMPAGASLRSRWVWIGAGFLVIFLLIGWTHQNIASSYSNTAQSLGWKGGDNLFDVQNQTLGFERIFAISLPSRTDQHDQLALASKVTGFKIEIIDGVYRDDIEDKVLPQGNPDAANNISPGNIGAWRAHMNVVQKIVNEDIQTALILEGDVDWDMRFKDQLVEFAKASRVLVQPKIGTNETLDPTFPMPGPNDTPTNLMLEDSIDLVTTPTTSPYGDVDNWDVLWIGHCGTRFTKAEHEIALGRVVISNDRTVPQPRWLDMQFGSQDLKLEYPNNTRVVHHAYGNVCTLGYAVTQKAAQKILYELGVNVVNGATDIMLRDMCDGRKARPKLNCLSVTPQIMQHHRPKGLRSAFTDIGKQSQAIQKKAYTKNVRFSTRINLPQLIYGWTNFTEQWSDEEPGPK